VAFTTAVVEAPESVEGAAVRTASCVRKVEFPVMLYEMMSDPNESDVTMTVETGTLR